ncbi:type VII secretion target [Rhodococcus sp. NPDC076796]|uniref:WXG100 family type VII secretion target n=1 Tax=Rhodococcus sp. NPDC076796 TaxID=3154859 RepID=UPI00344E25F8
MTDEVTVDPAVLWAAASNTRSVADDADQRLRATEDAMAGCGQGWGPRSRPAFVGFVDELAVRRRALADACENLASGLASAAHGYEQADDLTQSNVVDAASAGPSDSGLRL